MQSAAPPEIADAPLLRVPFESLKRAAKERKALVDEASEVLGALGGVQGAAREQQLQHLDALVVRLQGIKRKLEEVSQTEQQEAACCKARLEHMKATGTPVANEAVVWTKRRLDRLLADHMLRCGYHATAEQLVVSQPALAPLLDQHIFADARRVVAALRAPPRDCAPALEWCAAHRSRLKKIRSPLEFRLRLQQFIELVREDRRMEAIAHARKHLAPWAGVYMQELQRALATLAFTAHTKCPTYRPLFEDGRWEDLVELFHKELYRLHNLPPESLLTVHLQAGLSALKTPAMAAAAVAAAAVVGSAMQEQQQQQEEEQPMQNGAAAAAAEQQQQQQQQQQQAQPDAAAVAGRGGSRDDPLHLPAFQKLAEGLPFAKHVFSKLICSVTREIMNDANPPMVLPNGYVYSQKAVQIIAARNGGRMVCPCTGSTYTVDELRRAYIV